MTGTSLDEARAALRARQGAGARYDDPSSPREALALARRGTAYFARLLGALSDDAFRAPSDRHGWSRAMVVAHVGYHARALATYVEARQAGAPVTESYLADDIAIARAGTLPSEALKHLFQHSAKHLDVTWRDLDAVGWEQADLATLPEVRAKEVWHSSLTLGSTGRIEDLPSHLREE